MATDKNKHLECVHKSHKIENNENLMESYRSKSREIKTDLLEKYKGQIYNPFNSGSYKKATAVNIKFDIDVIVPFKKDEADTLETIFNNVFEYFNNDYKKKDSTLLSVKKQKVSVGLEFLVDEHMLYLDIVPGREINEYEKDGDLNLFVNDTMGLFKKSTYLKSNIKKQIDKIRENSEARDSIKFLKIWKRCNNISVKSFFLELITIKSVEEHTGDLPSEYWAKLKYTLEYIRDEIETVSLVDPGNTNNIVSDSLNTNEKKDLSNTIKWMLTSIENNEDNIKNFFPVNIEFPCETKEEARYIVSSEKKADKLSSNDFG
jgi:hypothetical protein